MMRVAINLLFLQPTRNGGCETYVRELLNEFDRFDNIEFLLFTNSANHDSLSQFARLKRQLTPLAGSKRLQRVIFEQTRLCGWARRARADVLFCPGNLSPVWPTLPTVVTIHDVQFKYHSYVPLLQRLAYTFLIPQASRRAAAVLTVSSYSASQIKRCLNIQPTNIRVTLEGPKRFAGLSCGANAEVVLKKYGVSRPYLLCVSSGFRYKNRGGLIQAFRQLKVARNEPLQLVFVGNASEQERKQIPAELSTHVQMIGYVPDSDLAEVYRNACAFVLPSLYEGFGMPVLEAMSFALPVACSNTASLPEIAGDAAILFDPTSTRSIAEALETIAFDEAARAKLVLAGQRNLKRFSWSRCAEETAAALLSVVHGRSAVGRLE